MCEQGTEMDEDRGSTRSPVDRPSIDELLQRHLGALQVFVRLHAGAAVRQRESCSDLVQSTCRELIAGIDRFEFRGEAQFRRWLFAAALNKIRERHRYHTAERRDAAREVDADAALGPLYASLLTPSRVAMARETVERIERAFDALPEHYREVILLCRLAGLSHEEVAQQTGRTVDAVRNLLFRALSRLAALADLGDDARR